MTLEWLTQYLPYSSFLGVSSDLYSLTLSLIVEFPRTHYTVELLSELFCDAEDLEADVQDQLQSLLKEWQGVFLDNKLEIKGRKSTRLSKRTMSFLFHQKSKSVYKKIHKKAKMFGEYASQVFISCDNKSDFCLPVVGARPCESYLPFIEFLEMFFEISFKNIQNAEHIPLLSTFIFEIEESCLGSVENKAENKESVLTPRVQRTTSYRERSTERDYSTIAGGMLKTRSQSVNDLRTLDKSSKQCVSLTDLSNIIKRNSSYSRNSSSRNSSSSLNAVEACEDPLKSVETPGNVNLGVEFEKTKQYLKWLKNWTQTQQPLNKKHSLSHANNIMHININIQTILYSLWLIKRQYIEEMKDGHSKISKISSDIENVFSHKSTEKKHTKSKKKRNMLRNRSIRCKENISNQSYGGIDDMSLDCNLNMNVNNNNGDDEASNEESGFITSDDHEQMSLDDFLNMNRNNNHGDLDHAR